jgi:signal peptidase II
MTRFVWAVAILIFCTGIDQAIKIAAKNTLIASPPISIGNDLIRIEYIQNPGAILGLGANLPTSVRLILMTIFVGLTLTTTFVFVFKPPASLAPMQLAGLSLIAAGGLGNLLDRIFNQGMVIDYVSFGVGGLRTGIMNMADIAIFAGAVAIFFFYKKADAPSPV